MTDRPSRRAPPASRRPPRRNLPDVWVVPHPTTFAGAPPPPTQPPPPPPTPHPPHPRTVAGAAAYDGDLLEHDPLRLGVQHLGEDHRAHPESMRRAAILEAHRRAGAPAHWKG